MIQERPVKYKIVVNLENYTVSIDPNVSDTMCQNIRKELGIDIPTKAALVKVITTILRLTALVATDYTFILHEICKVFSSVGVLVTIDRLTRLITYFGNTLVY